MEMSEISRYLASQPSVRPHLKNKKLMTFVHSIKHNLNQTGTLTSKQFDEYQFLTSQKQFLSNLLNISKIRVFDAQEDPTAKRIACPGEPFLKFL